MSDFFSSWSEAAVTTVGLFWMALWAFGLGYLISACIQVFLTRARMQELMGETGPKSVALGTFFGFISSSCSFAALSTTRALFTRGAGLVPSLAFLLASTNLVVELGVVIAIFLSWQFVVGEYVGGLLLILVTWLLVRLTCPQELVEQAREHAQALQGDADGDTPDRPAITSRRGWLQVARAYLGEWRMVWKDVSIGFTVAGIIAVFVPDSAFEALFVGSGGASGDPGVGTILLQALVGPLAAFVTFIGSMGNIPLAAVLFSHGVSFAGVMAFIFSDLVVFPVLRVQAEYYGWRFALYVAGLFLVGLVGVSVAMHLGLAAIDLLPDPSTAKAVTERDWFSVDYTLFLDILFLLLSAGALIWTRLEPADGKHDHGGDPSLLDRILTVAAVLSLSWLAIGLGLAALG